MRLRLRLLAPLQKIKARFVNAGYLINNKPHPRFIWKALNKDQIIHMYNSILRGYINYYFHVYNYGKLVSLVRWILWFSCARLLAAKYSTNVAKIVKKYGLTFQGKDKVGLLKPAYSNKPGLFIKRLSSPLISLNVESKSIASLYKLSCTLCQSTYRVEMHHVKMMKDLNPQAKLTDKMMTKSNRKQIALCRKCHMEHHKLKV